MVLQRVPLPNINKDQRDSTAPTRSLLASLSKDGDMDYVYTVDAQTGREPEDRSRGEFAVWNNFPDAALVESVLVGVEAKLLPRTTKRLTDPDSAGS